MAVLVVVVLFVDRTEFQTDEDGIPAPNNTPLDVGTKPDDFKNAAQTKLPCPLSSAFTSIEVEEELVEIERKLGGGESCLKPTFNINKSPTGLLEASEQETANSRD